MLRGFHGGNKLKLYRSLHKSLGTNAGYGDHFRAVQGPQIYRLEQRKNLEFLNWRCSIAARTESRKILEGVTYV
jgi:hypothetical protein